MNEKLTLNKFKLLTPEEKVAYINGFCDGEKKQDEIKELVGFTGFSQYISKEFAKWDKSLKKYVLVGNDNSIEEDSLTQEEILFLKKFILENKNKRAIDEIEAKDIITRSYRVSKKISEEFSNYCKSKGLSQTKVLNYLINKFITE